MKNNIALLAVLVLLPLSALAQEEGEQDVSPIPAGNIACFDYYRLDSVRMNIQANSTEFIPGTSISFSGEIINTNDYPLLEGKLTAKIFRRNDTTFFAGNGNELVDQFVIEENIPLDGGESRKISFNWMVPNTAQGGEYYATYFFSTSGRYDITGLSFSDDMAGEGKQTSFEVKAAKESKTVSFIKNEVMLNGETYQSARDPLHFTAEQTVTAKVKLKNPTDQVKTLPVQWNQYDGDASRDKNRKNTKTELVTLQPNETREITYQVLPTASSVVYITAITKDEDSKSFLNIRYVRDGNMESRIVFPGITQFPLRAGEEQMLFSCAQAQGVPEVKDNILILTLKDRYDQVITQYRYEGVISEMMSGFGNKFVPEKDYDYVKLEASLFRGGSELEKVETVYDCHNLNSRQCQEKSGIFERWLTSKGMIIGGIGLLGILTIFGALVVGTRKRNQVKW